MFPQHAVVFPASVRALQCSALLVALSMSAEAHCSRSNERPVQKTQRVEAGADQKPTEQKDLRLCRRFSSQLTLMISLIRSPFALFLPERFTKSLPGLLGD